MTAALQFSIDGLAPDALRAYAVRSGSVSRYSVSVPITGSPAG
jgi:hypothetical protein